MNFQKAKVIRVCSKGDENIKLEVERRMRNASYIFGIVKDREGDSGKKTVKQVQHERTRPPLFFPIVLSSSTVPAIFSRCPLLDVGREPFQTFVQSITRCSTGGLQKVMIRNDNDGED